MAEKLFEELGLNKREAKELVELFFDEVRVALSGGVGCCHCRPCSCPVGGGARQEAMSYFVVFSPEAEEQIVELYRYIAVAASTEIAARYTEAIVAYCESLRSFPHRGTKRDDIRPGLRITLISLSSNAPIYVIGPHREPRFV